MEEGRAVRSVTKAASRRAGLGSEIAELFAANGLETDIPELRGPVIRPARFR